MAGGKNKKRNERRTRSRKEKNKMAGREVEINAMAAPVVEDVVELADIQTEIPAPEIMTETEDINPANEIITGDGAETETEITQFNIIVDPRFLPEKFIQEFDTCWAYGFVFTTQTQYNKLYFNQGLKPPHLSVVKFIAEVRVYAGERDPDMFCVNAYAMEFGVPTEDSDKRYGIVDVLYEVGKEIRILCEHLGAFGAFLGYFPMTTNYGDGSNYVAAGPLVYHRNDPRNVPTYHSVMVYGHQDNMWLYDNGYDKYQKMDNKMMKGAFLYFLPKTVEEAEAIACKKTEFYAAKPPNTDGAWSTTSRRQRRNKNSNA